MAKFTININLNYLDQHFIYFYRTIGTENIVEIKNVLLDLISKNFYFWSWQYCRALRASITHKEYDSLFNIIVYGFYTYIHIMVSRLK